MEITTTRPDNQLVVPDVPILGIYLTDTEKEIVSLSASSGTNPKIKDADLLTLAEKISNTVNIRLGLNPRLPDDEVVFLQILEADINKFPQLTAGEIFKILEMGLDGFFDSQDKDIFFNSSKFVRWIRSYIEHSKKPAMSKYAQSLHQVNVPILPPSEQARIKNLVEITNRYTDDRSKDPDRRVVGGALLYQALEELGLHKVSDEEKAQIAQDIKKRNLRIASYDDFKALCQNEAYNRFIAELAEFEMMLDRKGKVVSLHAQLEIRRLSLLFEEIIHYMSWDADYVTFTGVVHSSNVDKYELRKVEGWSFNHELNLEHNIRSGETLFYIEDDLYIACSWTARLRQE